MLDLDKAGNGLAKIIEVSSANPHWAIAIILAVLFLICTVGVLFIMFKIVMGKIAPVTSSTQPLMDAAEQIVKHLQEQNETRHSNIERFAEVVKQNADTMASLEKVGETLINAVNQLSHTIGEQKQQEEKHLLQNRIDELERKLHN